jgi:hypothetical protein
MSAMTRIRSAAAVSAALALAACRGDGPLTPSDLPSGVAGTADVLARRRPLSRDVVASATIGRAGGTLALEEAGLTLTVPPGAVRLPTTFTITALAGDLVAYEFGPHGWIFHKPLRVTQRLQGIDHGALQGPLALSAAYFPDRERLDFWRRKAGVDEVLPVDVDAGRGRVSFSVRHFSGYLVSSGGTRGGDDKRDDPEDLTRRNGPGEDPDQ